MQTTPSSITGSWSPASRTSKSPSLQRHWGEECGRYWIHCRRHRGAVARILVMDDDGTLRGAIRVALEAAGYEVLEAADGHAVASAARARGRSRAGGHLHARAGRAGSDPRPSCRATKTDDRRHVGWGPDRTNRGAGSRGGFGRVAHAGKPFEPRQLLKVIRELLGERAVS